MSFAFASLGVKTYHLRASPCSSSLFVTGREAFPRNYSCLAQLPVESVKREDGAEGLREPWGRLGSAVAGLSVPPEAADSTPGPRRRENRSGAHHCLKFREVPLDFKST